MSDQTEKAIRLIEWMLLPSLAAALVGAGLAKRWDLVLGIGVLTFWAWVTRKE